jgi:hypothetical protein
MILSETVAGKGLQTYDEWSDKVQGVPMVFGPAC